MPARTSRAGATQRRTCTNTSSGTREAGSSTRAAAHQPTSRARTPAPTPMRHSGTVSASIAIACSTVPMPAGSPRSRSSTTSKTISTTVNTSAAATAASTNRIVRGSVSVATVPNVAAAASVASARSPALCAMRVKARCSQCTASSGPTSNATHHGPSRAASSWNATTDARIAAASAVAASSLGNNATRLMLRARSTANSSTGAIGGSGCPATRSAAPAPSAAASRKTPNHRTARVSPTSRVARRVCSGCRSSDGVTRASPPASRGRDRSGDGSARSTAAAASRARGRPIQIAQPAATRITTSDTGRPRSAGSG